MKDSEGEFLVLEVLTQDSRLKRNRMHDAVTIVTVKVDTIALRGYMDLSFGMSRRLGHKSVMYRILLVSCSNEWQSEEEKESPGMSLFEQKVWLFLVFIRDFILSVCLFF
jgi:hypothetical protein